MIADLEAAVIAAERRSADAYAVYRRALRRWTEADMRLLSARLDLEEALTETLATTGLVSTGKARP